MSEQNKDEMEFNFIGIDCFSVILLELSSVAASTAPVVLICRWINSQNMT